MINVASSAQISIITVCFNSASTIEKTIKSVINQDYKNIEYIIIDGSSVDGTQNIIAQYKDKITTVISEPDTGIYDAMNKGIKIATGDWLFFLNSGDIFFNSTTLSKIVPQLNNDFVLVFGDIVLANLDNSTTYIPQRHITNLAGIIIGVCHQAVFFSTQINKELLFYSKNLKYCSDLETLLKIENYYSKKKIKKIDIPICYYLSGGLSDTNLNIVLDERKRIINSFYKRYSIKWVLNRLNLFRQHLKYTSKKVKFE
ncbi:MAG: glycosyltransferase [Bacteroidetes bacterium]|nr:glycosyltransferase [Bacteroidota bacterium]